MQMSTNHKSLRIYGSVYEGDIKNTDMIRR